MTLCRYMAFIFEINEYLPKEHKLTDFQIAKCWVDEFPKLRIPQQIFAWYCGELPHSKQRSIACHRNYYNLGKLRSQKNTRDGPISFAYNEIGQIVDYLDRPLTQEAIQKKLDLYGPDRRDTQQFDWETVKMFSRAKKPLGRPTYKSFDWCI